MITIKNFVFNSFQVNCFVLSDETNEAILIDPACSADHEANQLIEYITGENLQLKAIVNTHAHVDHLLGVARFRDLYSIPFYLHAEDSFLIDVAPQSAQMFGFEFNDTPVVDKYIDEQTKIEFGNSSLKAIHVPGHSPGSLCYYSADDKFLIAGDVLFNGSIGRTDLPKGNHEQLISGIKGKLLNLPSDTTVYCGHGPKTNIQHEKDTNPFLR